MNRMYDGRSAKIRCQKLQPDIAPLSSSFPVKPEPEASYIFYRTRHRLLGLLK